MYSIKNILPHTPNLTAFLQSDTVGKIRKVIISEDFLNHECNCNSTIKVKGTCDSGGEYRAYLLVYKMTCILYLSVYAGNTIKTLNKRMEQNFQDVAQTVHHNKNSYTFEAHLAQNFNQKRTQQQCHEIMRF